VTEKVVRKLVPGQSPSFLEAHVIQALEAIMANQTLGRGRLGKMLGLGGGVTRTLVRRLVSEGLIDISKSGMTLTIYGEKVLGDFQSLISVGTEIPQSLITIGPFNVAILVRNASSFVKNGIAQRDAAIKVGALGATTLIFENDRLNMPGVGEKTVQSVQPIYNLLKSELKPNESDVIIIGSANDRSTAELAAKVAGIELLKSQ
jgi:hypothetical protein